MVFSSLVFLSVFLPLFLAVYYLLPARRRNLWLLVASLVFYSWGEPIYIILMVFSSLWDYLIGLGLARFPDDLLRRKTLLLLSIMGNVLVLGFFKYADFIIINLNLLPGVQIPLLNLPLPIGISFYTFQTMSYTIDVYRRNVPAQRDFISFAAYVTMFPQLIAGPIVRYIEVAKELEDRRGTLAQFASGAETFTLGLCYKVLIANNVGILWERMKAVPSNELTLLSAWLGILAFSLQIYFDFSGYSLMAIGLGRILGFEYPQNFNYPYISQSISEFWRRWHMTLGNWFREYVYIPLGGNRKGTWNTLRNLAIVWILTGIWHGASWNFLLWGCYYGVIIILERVAIGGVLLKVPRILRHLYTLMIVAVGWVIFETADPGWGVGYLRALLGGTGFGLQDFYFRYEALSFGFVLFLGVILATDLPEKVLQWLSEHVPTASGWLRLVLMSGGLILSLAYIVDSGYNPFLYLRF